MQLLLAPMEGVLDFALRDALTRLGGVDRCVSEFIRITDQLLPERVFVRVVPELRQGGCTPAGVPVRPQLLGSDPACLADNAARVASLGAPGVDLNFGCPAKIVNRHGGGAALLEEPERLWRIMQAVRRAVPASVPVSAKMRLGLHDDQRAEECARALAEGGASELVVHARTRAQGYRPPAYWQRIADVRAHVTIPVIANGEIWTVEDALRCQAESGCTSLMLGRGQLSDPGLAQAVRAAVGGASAAVTPPPTWEAIRQSLLHYAQRIEGHVEPRHRAGRIKQWLHYLRRRFVQAQQTYDAVRTFTDSREVVRWLGTAPERPLH